MKLFAALVLLTITAGCVPNSYPAGATPYQKWKIDRYYEEQLQKKLDSFGDSTPEPYRWY